MAIRFTQIDANLIRTLNKRVSRKIRYWKNKPSYELKSFLPEIQSTKQLISEFKETSRKELNDWIRESKNFLKRGSTEATTLYGKKVPKFYAHEFRVASARNKKIKIPERTIYKGNLYTLEAENEGPLRPLIELENVNFQKYLNAMKKKYSERALLKKNKLYIENFKKAMLNAGWSTEDYQKISWYLDNLDTNYLFHKTIEDTLLHLQYVYDIKANSDAPKTMIEEFELVFGKIPE